MRRALPLLAVLLSVGCRQLEPLPEPAPSDPARALDWTLGRWEGFRTGSADGVAEPMTMVVESILGGAGQTRAIEIPHGGGVYRGFAVQVYDPARDRWVRRYVNDVRRTFASLEGEEGGAVWRSTSPGRTRDSRLVYERPTPDTWRRTMSVSEDGGATWRVLWTDLLARATTSGCRSRASSECAASAGSSAARSGPAR